MQPFNCVFKKKNVISDPEPFLQEFDLKNTEDTLAHDGCVNDPHVILSKYSYQIQAIGTTLRMAQLSGKSTSKQMI